MNKTVDNDFQEKYCSFCGSQHCTGEGEWLEGCLHYKAEEKKELTEQEIFEKLKEALDYQYMYDSFDLYNKEIDNLDDYLKLIKQERALEKDFDDYHDKTFNTYKEFINYLADKSIGDTSEIIEEFNNCTHVNFEGYKKVTKEIKDNELYLIFQIGESNFKAKWQEGSNYAVWQTCGICGDDYSGYMLLPTHNKNEYFCLYYQC